MFRLTTEITPGCYVLNRVNCCVRPLWTAVTRPYLDPSFILCRFIHEVSPKREGHCVMVRNVDWLWWLRRSFDSV